MQQGKSKFKAVKTVVNGVTFASKREAKRYQELLLAAKAKLIKDLELQPKFVLAPSVRFEGEARAKPALRYVADFSYLRDGVRVIEDSKGVQTDAFRIKRHLMKSVHGIEVKLV